MAKMGSDRGAKVDPGMGVSTWMEVRPGVFMTRHPRTGQPYGGEFRKQPDGKLVPASGPAKLGSMIDTGADFASGVGRGMFGMDAPESMADAVGEGYKTGQALSNMPGIGSLVAVSKLKNLTKLEKEKYAEGVNKLSAMLKNNPDTPLAEQARATGVFKDTDGQLKTWISDEGFKQKPNTDLSTAKMFKPAPNGAIEYSPGSPLRDFYEHPEIDRLVPGFLDQMSIGQFDRLSGNSGLQGMLVRQNINQRDTPALALSRSDKLATAPEEFKGTLAHEALGHGLQQLFGFEQGGSTGSVPALINRFYNDYRNAPRAASNNTLRGDALRLLEGQDFPQPGSREFGMFADKMRKLALNEKSNNPRWSNLFRWEELNNKDAFEARLASEYGGSISMLKTLGADPVELMKDAAKAKASGKRNLEATEFMKQTYGMDEDNWFRKFYYPLHGEQRARQVQEGVKLGRGLSPEEYTGLMNNTVYQVGLQRKMEEMVNLPRGALDIYFASEGLGKK